jgi:hypothetical protein
MDHKTANNSIMATPSANCTLASGRPPDPLPVKYKDFNLAPAPTSRSSLGSNYSPRKSALANLLP